MYARLHMYICVDCIRPTKYIYTLEECIS